ncbi:unnamed protein product [Brassicogethes aeneus]|uniref:Uncharacterized protein n=1 Tax=Brassicogethes aeneus TaxID=1431903 RepID=A0A9P0AYY4_BRAAE|nr:unnamed protein product [Brassicogethes aeneus]
MAIWPVYNWQLSDEKALKKEKGLFFLKINNINILYLIFPENISKLDYYNKLESLRRQEKPYVSGGDFNAKSKIVTAKSLKVISSKIIHALADDEGLNDDAVENYILGATYEVVQDLLKHILNSIHLDASTRFSCLQVLLREDVKKLDTGIFPNSYYDKILQTICAKGKRLQHLNLREFGTGHIDSANKERTIKTKLTYLHDTGTNLDVIGAILNLCPNLESIHVANPEPGVIEKLVCIKKLNCLKLTRPIAAELMYLLRMSGPQLQVLKLNHNKNCSLDLSEICVNAPNLQTLECFQIKLTFSQLDTFFMCLSNVEILYCEVSDFVIKLFLSNSPFLKRIVVGCVINMTDGDLFRLCAGMRFY